MWSQWACIHILMYVHIATKVWDQKRGNRDMHTGLHRGGDVCAQLFKGVGVDVGSQVYIHTSTGACTDSKEGVGPDKR